jgi:hypothetical protein
LETIPPAVWQPTRRELAFAAIEVQTSDDRIYAIGGSAFIVFICALINLGLGALVALVVSIAYAWNHTYVARTLPWRGPRLRPGETWYAAITESGLMRNESGGPWLEEWPRIAGVHHAEVPFPGLLVLSDQPLFVPERAFQSPDHQSAFAEAINTAVDASLARSTAPPR